VATVLHTKFEENRLSRFRAHFLQKPFVAVFNGYFGHPLLKSTPRPPRYVNGPTHQIWRKSVQPFRRRSQAYGHTHRQTHTQRRILFSRLYYL